MKGKVIWITGASSGMSTASDYSFQELNISYFQGIGECLAYVCASVGAKVALSGTNRERLENVAKRCLGEKLANVLFVH